MVIQGMLQYPRGWCRGRKGEQKERRLEAAEADVQGLE